LLGVYIDTFVREAVVRCAYERGEKEGEGVSGKDNRGEGEGVGATGWLEVGDLERVGVQLVLDF
jgi:CENP-S associating Centromere protein X